MANRNDYIIVSVESRKGGVGKTTVALNMAKLLSDNYHVLVLDIDVTGTSIHAIENISVWKKSVKLLKDIKGVSINLLQFFKEQYLSGSCNMRFAQTSSDNAILVYSDFVNVMGSELYSANGSMLYDPSIIFDEIHDYWLLDMIRKISLSFSDAFDDGKKCLIILDNSPGYVGLGKSIHDMLTDMGPERGKFLSVSSLDTQDIDSCIKAVKNIHTLTQEKEKGAAFFHESQSRDLTTLALGSVEHETFNRLAIGDEDLSYYAGGATRKSEVCDYQALVFNKVPLNVKNGSLIYEYDKENKELWDVFTALCGEDPQNYMVPYDESIHYQFFKNNLVLARTVDNAKQERLDKQIGSLIRRAHKLDEYFELNEWRRIAYSLNTLNRDLGRLPDLLEEVGLFDQASHVNPAWLPESVFRAMFRCLQDMEIVSNNRDFYFPFFLPREFLFERILTLEYLDPFPKVECAVKSILVVLESFLKQNENGILVVGDLIHDILSYCLKKGLPKDVTIGCFFMNCAHCLRNDADDFTQLFQAAFLETLARVLDLSEDITILCTSLSFFNEHGVDSESQLDANVSWVIDKKIITKDICYGEAKELIYKELSDSDYMAIVRQVISPIIVRWGL